MMKSSLSTMDRLGYAGFTRSMNNTNGITLIIGGTGKTGSRVATRLAARGRGVRIGSRSGEPPFDWHQPATWEPTLRDVTTAYLTYHPDIGYPGAAETIGAFAGVAVDSGVRRLVLLSGRGSEEALPSEEAVRHSGAEWTILRGSWFCQNFSEGFLLDQVLTGVIAMPAGVVTEPFVDTDDVADVAVAALTEDRHAGVIYELSGPRALTFAEAAEEIGAAAGREVRYQPITKERFASALAAELPAESATFLADMLTKELDGRNSDPTDGVRLALDRKPTDFADYARTAAATGVWKG